VYNNENSTQVAGGAKSRGSQPLMDQLCIVTTDKTLVFYEFQGSGSQTYKFEEDKSISDKGYPIGGSLPNQILWDNDIIYLGSKKAYTMMSKRDGSLLQTVLLVN
jgi:hypothetical protein